MKTIIKTFCAAMVALFTTTVLAVDPVAVWSGFNGLGDSGSLTQNGVTLILNEKNTDTNTESGGIVTIGKNSGNGLLATWGTSTALYSDRYVTVLIAYSDLSFPSTGYQALSSYRCGREKNICGLSVNSSGKIYGIWQGRWWDGTEQTQNSLSAKSSDVKYMAFYYNTTDAQNQDTGSGTRLFTRNDNGTYTRQYAAWGLRGTGVVETFGAQGVSVGGVSDNASGTGGNTLSNTSCGGMKIYKMAIFPAKMTVDDLAAYEFPASQEDKPTGRVINFNFRNGGAANADGAIDGKGVQTTLAGDMPEASWNQNTNLKGDKTGNNIWDSKTSTSEADSNLKISWSDYYTTYNNCGYTEENPALGVPDNYAYLRTFEAYRNPGTKDDSSVEYANFKVENIPFAKYEVIVYCNGNNRDGSKAVFNCVNVNGTDYTVDEDGELVAGTGTWGATRQTSAAFGTNAFVFRNGTASTFEVKMKQVYANLAAFQIVEIDGGKKSVEVDCGTEYSMSDANAVTGDTITLKFADAGGKLLVDEAPSRKYMIKCAGAMEILGDDDYTITQADFNKLTLTQVSGGLTIDATGGLEMNDAIKSAIKSATSDKTYTFIGVGNTGATLDYGDNNDGTQLKTHIVFKGGAHSMKYRCESAGLKFGANATADNPTLRVTDGATLTFAARNLCGWTSGNADANGIIRVDDGSKLVLNPTGGTLYWAQRLYLEPGAKLEFTDSGSNFRINGGTAEATAQIYVPASASDTTAKPAIIEQKGSSGIYANNQASAGFAIFVGENSKLQIDALLAQQNGDSPIVKRGAGALEVLRGISCNSFEVAAGSFACDETISALTIDAGATLDVSAGAPTVTNSLTLPETLNLAGEPTHGMTVLTVPNGYSLEGELPAAFNARACAVYLDGGALKLKWKIPPTVIEIDPEADIEAKPSVDYTKSTVAVKVNYSGYGDYAEGDMDYQIIIGEKTYTGVASGEGDKKTVSFEIDELEGGKIYRGEFQVIYGEDSETAATAPIVIRQGKLIYVEKNPWVNEKPLTLKTTGSYDPESGVSVVGEMIQINTNKEVTFTPNPDPDYVDKCDSSFTISIMADEAIDDTDQAIEDGAQAGVQIVSDGKGGVVFQFIVGDEWVNGPKAELNKLYEVTISFHYAKAGVADDEDSVTYTVKDLTQKPVVADRRANTANKVEEIIFYDGTQFASLVGTCEIEKADPIPQGMEPGAAEKELKATDETAAQTEAGKIPVVVPSEVEGDLTKGLDDEAAKEAKEKYKALFKVVAVKKGDKYVAEVVFTDKATEDIEKDEKGIVSAIVEAIGSLFEGEGELGELNGQPGLYYGIATDGELVKMGKAMPEDWVIANGEGKIVGLKVKKTANAKQGFYKVICTPKPTKKDN